MPELLSRLLEAKRHSDNKRYDRKNQIIRELMRQSPSDWVVDDSRAYYRGVTHMPTRFRLHVDPAIINSQVQQLAKQAASRYTEKEAFAYLRAAVPALRAIMSSPTAGKAISAASSTAKTTAPALKNFIAPTVKAKPNLVAAARPLPENPALNRLTRAVNSFANVPKGENFRQRPLANTFRLLSADGVPGMRRLGQASLLSGLGLGGYMTNEANKYVNQNLETLERSVKPFIGNKLPAGYDLKKNLYGAKWDLLKDQTVGSIYRWFTGQANDKQKYVDSLIRSNVIDAAGRYLTGKKHESKNRLADIYQAIKAYRSPAAAAKNLGTEASKNVVFKPRNLPTIISDTYRDLSGIFQNKEQPSTIEEILANRFKPVLDSLRR